MIFSIALLSFGCAGVKKVGPAPIIPYCSYIDQGTPYSYCRNSVDNGKRWSVPLNESQNNKWIMTTPEGFSAAWAYGEKVNKYIEQLEKRCGDRCN